MNDMELWEITEAIRKVSDYKADINDYLDLLVLWYLSFTGRSFKVTHRDKMVGRKLSEFVVSRKITP